MLRAEPSRLERQDYRALYGLPVRFGAPHDALVISSRHLTAPATGLAKPSAASLHYLAYNERQLRLIRPQTRWSDAARHLLPTLLLVPGPPQVTSSRPTAGNGPFAGTAIEAFGAIGDALAEH